MTQLSFKTCDRVSKIVWPSQVSELNLQSKAIEVITDFRINRPLVIDCNTKAIEAEYLMKKAHVKLKLVLDEDKHFLGTVSYNDLNNQEIIKKIASGNNRVDLCVSDFMKSKTELIALDWSSLKNATIRTLLVLLANSNDQHVLVTDNEGSNIRGIISASDIARALHVDVDLSFSVSFKLISKAISKSNQHAA